MTEQRRIDSLIVAGHRYVSRVSRELRVRWTRWPKDLSRSQLFESVGGLLARQATLAIEIVRNPTVWNGHVAPVLLRTMVDTHITLAWILQSPDERSKEYVLHGLGQVKLEIEHRKARWGEEGPNPADAAAVQALENWLNSQRWDFLTEVNVGSWSDLPTRRMAEECGLRDFYNHVYTPFSAATHSMWHHVARFNLAHCGNPLHRYHRVPFIRESHIDAYYAVLAGKYFAKSLDLFDTFYKLGVAKPKSYRLLMSELRESRRGSGAARRATDGPSAGSQRMNDSGQTWLSDRTEKLQRSTSADRKARRRKPVRRA